MKNSTFTVVSAFQFIKNIFIFFFFFRGKKIKCFNWLHPKYSNHVFCVYYKKINEQFPIEMSTTCVASFVTKRYVCYNTKFQGNGRKKFNSVLFRGKGGVPCFRFKSFPEIIKKRILNGVGFIQKLLLAEKRSLPFNLSFTKVTPEKLKNTTK